MSTEFNQDKPGDDRRERDADLSQADRGRAWSQTQTRSGDVDAEVNERPASERHSETAYLPAEASGPADERWQRIQAAFVDDPRKSVTEAHQLVAELTQRIVDAFAEERDELERQWSKGADVSTEDLRVSLQRYRAFFSRLLPSIEQLTAQKKPMAAE